MNNMTTEEKIIEEIEVIINNYSPMVNFGVKEYCAIDIYQKLLLPKLQQHRKEVEHCDEPNCSECNLVAYNKGKADMLEEVKEKIEENLEKHCIYDVSTDTLLDGLQTLTK